MELLEKRLIENRRGEENKNKLSLIEPKPPYDIIFFVMKYPNVKTVRLVK